MAKQIVILVSDFSNAPGPRYRAEGQHSGQEFRENVLLPQFKAAQAEGCTLLVDLDGTAGYASSFLEEAFGGLSRIVGDPDEVLSRIELKSDDQPRLIERVTRYIRGRRR